jgi:glycosyltransferase involved in cell wall biosynthesis
MPAIAIAWLLRKCVIVNYHGGEARIFLERWGRIVKYVLARVDMVIVPSGFLKRVFLEHEVHCEIVPNVVDLSDFSYKLRRVFKPVFLVPRHLKPEYNVGCAIRAFRIIQDKLPEAELYITGTGSEERYLKHLAEDPRLRRVNFLGHVPHSEMPSLYRHCDMVLNTSNLDNLPCFILEAFASGVPVISTRAGGIPYVITDSQTGFLVDLNDHEGIASVALYLMENPDLARDITENARQAVEQYTWKTVESKLLGIYSRTLKSREICY